MGYFRAGFTEIVGVDLIPQPRYPFDFVQADALNPGIDLSTFDAIHASPPCQRYSWLTRINGTQDNHPDLIAPTREMLKSSNLPYVIENVPNSPLYDHFMLCGSMFSALNVWRHRWFEHSGFMVEVFDRCSHHRVPYPIDVTGTGGPCSVRTTAGGGLHRKPKNMAEANAAMGIDWLVRRELVQSIPPPYTEWIGKQILESLK